ncbi:MAG: hypothetical protein QME16_05490, partial [Planctomycetota bacterium]|nr:hypothetical protein [Planctomycetota bacterium]
MRNTTTYYIGTITIILAYLVSYLGVWLHLRENYSHPDCAGCQKTAQETHQPGLTENCPNPDDCHNPTHKHHNHPLHQTHNCPVCNWFWTRTAISDSSQVSNTFYQTSEYFPGITESIP